MPKIYCINKYILLLEILTAFIQGHSFMMFQYKLIL